MERAADHATVIRLKSVVFGSLPGRDILFYDFENVVILLESTPPASMFKLERKIRPERLKTPFGLFRFRHLDGAFAPHTIADSNMDFSHWFDENHLTAVMLCTTG